MAAKVPLTPPRRAAGPQAPYGLLTFFSAGCGFGHRPIPPTSASSFGGTRQVPFLPGAPFFHRGCLFPNGLPFFPSRRELSRLRGHGVFPACCTSKSRTGCSPRTGAAGADFPRSPKKHPPGAFLPRRYRPGSFREDPPPFPRQGRQRLLQIPPSPPKAAKRPFGLRAATETASEVKRLIAYGERSSFSSLPPGTENRAPLRSRRRRVHGRFRPSPSASFGSRNEYALSLFFS